MAEGRSELGKFNRREFLRRAAAAGALAAGAVVLARIVGKEKSLKSANEAFEQRTAADLLDKAQNENSLIEVRVVNPEGTKDPVNYRRTPAILNTNWMGKMRVGEEVEIIIVGALTGYQQAEGDNKNWAAFKTREGLVGFMRLDNVERADGHNIYTKGTKIYDLKTSEVTTIGQGTTPVDIK